MEYSDPLWSLGTIPYFPDNFGLRSTFTWAGGDIPDRDKATVRLLKFNQVCGKLFECVGEPQAPHNEIMTASRDKGSHTYGLGETKVHTCMSKAFAERQRFTHVWSRTVLTFPKRQSLQTVPQWAGRHCFGKELTELSNGSDYDVNACGYWQRTSDRKSVV